MTEITEDKIDAATEVESAVETAPAPDAPVLVNRDGHVIVPGTIKYMGPDRELAGTDVPIFTPTEVRLVRDQLGISRPGLILLSGLNGYRCWAAEQESKVDERDAIEWRIRVTEVLLAANRDGTPVEAKAKNRKSIKVNSDVDVEALNSRISDMNMTLALVTAGLMEIAEVKSLKEAKARVQALIELTTPVTDAVTIEIAQSILRDAGALKNEPDAVVEMLQQGEQGTEDK